jgi:hypothetical protein
MNIAIIGGGNIGTLMAAEFAAKGHDVRIVTSRPETFSHTLRAYDKQDNLRFEGRLSLATSDFAAACSDADHVIVTLPTFAWGATCDELRGVLKPGAKLGTVPGALGEFLFHPLLQEGVTLYGLARVHSIARVIEPGRSVYELGRKPRLEVAAIPVDQTHAVADDLRMLFGMEVIELPNYLTLTLTPSNPILHTMRIRELFKDWRPGLGYDENLLFYEGWDVASSERLLAADAEVQAICKALPELNLSGVVPLGIYYEHADPEGLAKKLAGIPAFKGLRSPMKQTPAGWEPDLANRYFSADFAYGMRAIQLVGDITEVDTPTIDEAWDWYCSLDGTPDPHLESLPFDKSAFLGLYR